MKVPYNLFNLHKHQKRKHTQNQFCLKSEEIAGRIKNSLKSQKEIHISFLVSAPY